MAVTTYRYNVPGNLAMENRGGTKSAYRFDARGSTTQLINTSATITDTFQFDSFGNQVSRTGTTATPFTFMAGISMYMPSGISPVFGVFGPLRWDPKAGGFTTGNSALLFELWLIRLAVERFVWWMWAQDFLKKVFSGGWPFIIAEPVPRINDPYRTPWPYPPRPMPRQKPPVREPGLNRGWPARRPPRAGRPSHRRPKPGFRKVSGFGTNFTYGNYCGSDRVENPAWGIQPQDCVDQCCLVHDRCLEAHYQYYMDVYGMNLHETEVCSHKCCDPPLVRCAGEKAVQNPGILLPLCSPWPKDKCCLTDAPSPGECLKAAKLISMGIDVSVTIWYGFQGLFVNCPPCLSEEYRAYKPWFPKQWPDPEQDQPWYKGQT
ncbi:MAG: hypothetical protein U0R49_11660 [Fimbriimonadales bacterium]